jgi:hypothetical protein
MAFIPLKDFLSIWHFKLIGLIGPRAMGERVKLPPLSCTQPPFDPTYGHFWIFPVSGSEFPDALL